MTIRIPEPSSTDCEPRRSGNRGSSVTYALSNILILETVTTKLQAVRSTPRHRIFLKSSSPCRKHLWPGNHLNCKNFVRQWVFTDWFPESRSFLDLVGCIGASTDSREDIFGSSQNPLENLEIVALFHGTLNFIDWNFLLGRNAMMFVQNDDGTLKGQKSFKGQGTWCSPPTLLRAEFSYPRYDFTPSV